MSERCPESHELAAWIDGVLDDPRRKELIRHVSSCATCLGVVSGTVDVLRELQPESQTVPNPQPRPSPHPRHREWLALVAATLVLAVAVPFAMSLMDVGPDLSALFQAAMARLEFKPREVAWREQLVAAAGETRPIEARLAGGFPWAPHTPTRGVTEPVLETGLWPVEELAETLSKSRNDAGLGAASVLLGRYDDAIAALEAARKASPHDAMVACDLSAAYLARSARSDAGDDARRALEAADAALALSPRMNEAAFNRALALERLDRFPEAIEAWRGYLALDPASEWAREASERAANLGTPGP